MFQRQFVTRQVHKTKHIALKRSDCLSFLGAWKVVKIIGYKNYLKKIFKMIIPGPLAAKLRFMITIYFILLKSKKLTFNVTTTPKNCHFYINEFNVLLLCCVHNSKKGVLFAKTAVEQKVLECIGLTARCQYKLCIL